MRVLVLFFAADEGLVGLDNAVQRTVKGLRFDGVAQMVGREPRGLLRHADILGKLGAGDALLVRRDKPDGQHPRAQWDFAILKNRADLDGEELTAIAALVGAVVGEVVNLGGNAVRAEWAILPTDRSEVVDRGLFLRDIAHHLKDGVELLNGGPLLMQSD